ncbi:DUF4031 domain-containing protein [Leifsonia sp. NPDC102414]|uniref:DUF4031 domain-containing protein n=1 Tax=Leifsonia sp. NPDC102414 TaxID=3364124 RepID=UPI003804834E
MVVYVDDMRRTATVRGMTRQWSHLVADTSAELRAFAVEIGLSLSWIQRPGTYREHFDVTDAMRAAALRHGAVAVSFEAMPALHRRLRERARAQRAGHTGHAQSA